jgi:uncharacterized membrane protein YdbT with pleckstrin-like domain
MQYFNLQEGEKIIWEAKPMPNLKWLFLIQSGFGSLILFAFIGFYIFALSSKTSFGFANILCLGAILIPIVLSVIYAFMKYNKEYYWITNRRAVHKAGLLGYMVYSIPLERVSDVVISRGFLENLLGFSSVHIQSLAGQSIPSQRMGAEGRFLAIQEPEKIQEMVFKLVKENRKDQKLSF